MIYTRIPIYNFYVRNYHSLTNLLQSVYSLCGVTFSWCTSFDESHSIEWTQLLIQQNKWSFHTM